MTLALGGMVWLFSGPGQDPPPDTLLQSEVATLSVCGRMNQVPNFSKPAGLDLDADGVSDQLTFSVPTDPRSFSLELSRSKSKYSIFSVESLFKRTIFLPDGTVRPDYTYDMHFVDLDRNGTPEVVAAVRSSTGTTAVSVFDGIGKDGHAYLEAGSLESKGPVTIAADGTIRFVDAKTGKKVKCRLVDGKLTQK